MNRYHLARAVSPSTSNMAIQAVMDREGEDRRGSPEATLDRFALLKPAEARAFPNRVLGEQICDPLGVVLVVAQRRIARFEIADRLRVLQQLQPPLNSFEPRRIKSIVLRHGVSSPLFRIAKPWPLSPKPRLRPAGDQRPGM